MEWNNPRYQAFCRQFQNEQEPDDHEAKEHEQEMWQSSLQNSLAGDSDVVAPPRRTSPPKMEFFNTLGNEGGGGMTFQSLNSLSMPQLQEATEFPPFYSSQGAYNAATLPQSLPSLPSPPSHQQELQPPPQQQFDGQLAMQFNSQYSDFPADSTSYYLRPVSFPSAPMPQAASRTSMDYFPEGIPALHSAHTPMPTLPTSFGSLEQQQQLLLPPGFEDQHGNFDSNMTHDMSSSMFRSSMAPTEPYNSSRTMRTLSIDSYATQSSVGSTPPDYSPVVAPLGRPKREGGLREPFTEMATTHEPKFSPDKRKLCCVEGCTSQARALIGVNGTADRSAVQVQDARRAFRVAGCVSVTAVDHDARRVAVLSHGRCKLHGGGRPCIVEGCEKKAHLKRLCRKHGGGTKCCVAGCKKWSQRQGMCMTHSKVVGSQPSDIDGDSILFDQKPSPSSSPDLSPPPSLEMFTEESMLDTTSYGSKPLQHDAETFQVAKELILLSHRPSSDNVMNITMNNNSPSTISGFFKHDIINSRCDISHLELLKEHRVRFRRVRRRWNVEQRTKKQQYLARFHPDRFLTDYNANWGLISRNGTRNNTNWTSSNALIPNINSTTLNGTGIGSPDGTSTIMDSFLPDYDSTLYSLWSAPGGSSVMGYETDTEAAPSQQQPVQPPLYLVSDDELKMDSSYPQLPEFNQDLDSYLNDTIESGGPSPTTPLGTSIANSGIKMDQLVTTDRRLNSRESQLEMLLAPTTTAESLVKRERATLGLENGAGRSANKFRGGHNEAYTLANTTGAMVEAVSSGITNSLRTISRNSTMKPTQRGIVMPSLASYQSGPMSSIGIEKSDGRKSQMEGSSIGTVTLTTIVTSPPSSTSDVKNGKRPRSRQCEFPGCQNRARSHQKCKKHGGAHQCVFEGCTKNSQSRGLCIAHGGGSRCKKEGCVRAAQSKGLCKSHGGGEYCAVDGCNKKAHLKHLCRTHGGGVRCKLEKCSKWAQRKGWCMAHAKEFAAP
ncbi:hypothetical protein DD238_005288 [Peronospora effusa]|uniref:WRKY19-like zinc finger domain-containing protein n=1 Tax=Peronospora effusa TaxID=542832 RepID=A0A3M6VR78_9STRA|nr:hypothetical protein DD238_005288 [Peronospora effusa]